MGISPETQKVLLKIYMGQNIRVEGILQSEIKEEEQKELLLSRGLIKENHWYLHQFLTTERGSDLGRRLVEKRIRETENQLVEKLGTLPRKVIAFFIRRYVSKKLAFSTERPYLGMGGLWEDFILGDSRIWVLWDRFFSSLESVGLCVKTWNYVSTRGGHTKDLCYVISPEIKEFLTSTYSSISDFTSLQENTMKLYPVLLSANRVLAFDDLDYARQQYYNLLKSNSIEEGQLAGIVNDMSKMKITSKYYGLLSEEKPFEILDLGRFQIYLGENLMKPAVEILLEEEKEMKEYTTEEKIPSLSEVKSELGILDRRDLGDFYILVSDLEQKLRAFIEQKLGKSYVEKMEKEIPQVVEGWKDKERKDRRWGIDPEKDLMNYADLGDYTQIIKQYDRLFTDGKEDLANITTYLQIWYNYGRNPIMHSRTVNRQKFYTTKSAIDFLMEWINRKS